MFAPASALAAGSTSKSDALVNQAVELRRSGDDQGALGLLQQAYGMGHAPRATGQLGLCEQALGQWADAEGHLLEALKADQDAWVKKSRRVLEDALVVVKSHIARVEVQGEPEGAEVLLNGVVAGKLPLAGPMRVAAGELEIELRAPGYARETKTLRLEAGQYQRVVLRASRAVAAATPPPAPAPVPVNVTVTTAPATAAAPAGDGGASSPAAVATVAPASSARGVYKWVAFGLGAAGLGVGAYGWKQNSDGTAAFDKAGCGILNGQAVNAAGSADPDCASKKSSYEAGTTLAVAGFAAGVVLIGAGVALWLTEPQPGATTTALACVPTVGAGLEPGVGCHLSF